VLQRIIRNQQKEKKKENKMQKTKIPQKNKNKNKNKNKTKQNKTKQKTHPGQKSRGGRSVRREARIRAQEADMSRKLLKGIKSIFHRRIGDGSFNVNVDQVLPWPGGSKKRSSSC